MAIASAPQTRVLEAIRERFGRLPWVEAVLVAPDPPEFHVWTVPPPPDEISEDVIYDREVDVIRAFPEAFFDFHFAPRDEIEDLKRAGVVLAFCR